jgi:hypothetical protein
VRALGGDTLEPHSVVKGAIIGSELDDAIEKMAHAALTLLCKSHLTATTEMLVLLFVIHDLEDPMWQQRLQAVSDLESPRFDTGWAAMAKYVKYLFNLNLHHNAGRTIIQQRMHLIAYEEQATATLCEIERLRHENSILRCSTLLTSD